MSANNDNRADASANASTNASANASTNASANAPRSPATISEYIEAHRFEDMLTILDHEPCAREGLLYGVGAGGAAAFLGLFKRGSLITAGNWGFLTFGVVAIASKQVCHYYQAQRRARNRLRLGIRPDGSLINVKNFKPDGANVQNFKPDSPASDKPGNSD